MATLSPAFVHRREELVRDIAIALEQVLQNMNKLNRGLEGVIAVGNEFGAVEALWSQFEGVMAKDPEEDKEGEVEKEGEDGEGEEGDDEGRDDDGEERR